MPTTTELATTCPHCNKFQDQATGKKNTRPRPGDVSICWKCFELGIYEQDLSLRKPSEIELQELLENPSIKEALRVTKNSNRPTEAMKKLESQS